MRTRWGRGNMLGGLSGRMNRARIESGTGEGFVGPRSTRLAGYLRHVVAPPREDRERSDGGKGKSGDRGAPWRADGVSGGGQGSRAAGGVSHTGSGRALFGGALYRPVRGISCQLWEADVSISPSARHGAPRSPD